MNNRQAIEKRLAGEQGFRSKSGVRMWTEAGKILVDAPFPGQSEDMVIELYLTKVFETADEFIDSCFIQTQQDLERLNSDHLLHLYFRGVFQIGCCTIDGLLLFFRKKAVTYAFDENTLQEHKVSREIITPRDFMKYTIDFYCTLCEKIAYWNA